MKMMKNKVDGVQVRTTHGEYHIHVQGLGPVEMNRPYGGAWELRANDDIVEWLSTQTPTHLSGASGERFYVKMDVVQFDNGTQALLIHGAEWNHPDGLLMGCDAKSPSVKQVIEFAYQTDVMRHMVYADKSEDVVDVENSEHAAVLEGEGDKPKPLGDGKWEYIDGEWVEKKDDDEVSE
tara:strand:+ start:1910 stop:2446 length:537 start_codon:yes stop_codon:yes gene_type:complete